MCNTSKPTQDVATEWQEAYNFFNRELFDGELPECLITVKAQPMSRGYFAWDRWENLKSKEQTDEISMNSLLFGIQDVKITLSTLVHEMVHLWHYRCDRETFSKSYHNKHWADKMELVGLMPSTDGTPNGKRTGRSCTHYIIEGGVFEAAANKLIGTGFGLTWADSLEGMQKPATGGEQGGKVTGSGAIPVTPKRAAKRKSKTKYSCSHSMCKSNAWAKSGMVLYCGDHETKPYLMVEVG